MRNPFDVIISCSTFWHVWSHSKQIENKIEEEDPQFWNTFVRKVVLFMKEFQDDCLAKIREKKVPVLFMKYEELCKEPREHL